MSPSVHRRSPARRSPSNLSDSPRRGRSSMYSRSPRRRSSPRKERSPVRRRSSPRTRSPIRTSSSHRARSPIKEKLHSRTKSPENLKSPKRLRSSISPSPSPRTKRLQRAKEEREPDKLVDRERERNDDRGGDRGRQRERGLDRDGPSERRTHEKYDGSSSRSRHGHSESLEDRGQRNRYNSSSPRRRSEGPGHDRQYDAKAGAHEEDPDSRGAEPLRDGDHDSVAKMKAAEESLEAKQKQKPSFELSGKLAAETNRVKGVTLLFTEPPDARKPDIRWRLYVFKGGEVLNEPLYVHRQSCYLFGRERRVADIPTDHPSCSKQHAVIQFRLVEKEKSDGLVSKKVRPYLMDLGSTNGTFINDNRIEPQRYYELVEKDTIKFGNSSREYVILHENSAE